MRPVYAEVIAPVATSRRLPPAPQTASDAAAALVWRCGKAALSAQELAALYDAGASLSPEAWGQAQWMARVHGMDSLVFKHTALADLLPLMPPGVVAELKRAYCATLVNNRRIQIELRRVLALLADRGVEVMLLKGVALASRYYHDIALRPVNDIDLLVRRQQLKRCLQALRDAGYAPTRGHGNALDFKVLYSLEMQYLHQRGFCIEPHVGLARLPIYNAALCGERTWERAEWLEMDGVTARYLRPVDELRYLSVHYAVPHRSERMLWLVDIAELVRDRARAWDWEAFTRETITLGLATPVALALGRTRELLDLAIPADVVDRLAVAADTPRERIAWQSANAALTDMRRFSQHLRALPRPNEQAAFIWGATSVAMSKARQRVAGRLALWHPWFAWSVPPTRSTRMSKPDASEPPL